MHSRHTIIFSPHLDDEVLGCFSWLRFGTHVIYGGVEERPLISKDTRIQELRCAADQLGFSWELLENCVNQYSSPSLIAPMERALNLHQPSTVLIPEPSYNQDHRAFYDAALVATRPHDRNWQVPQVLIFEQPHSVIWPHQQQPAPNYFLEIDIDHKLAAYRLYDSQVRGHRSPETLKALAALRGAQISKPYAEAFYAKRIIGVLPVANHGIDGSSYNQG